MKLPFKTFSLFFFLSIVFVGYGQNEIIAVSDDGQYIAVLHDTKLLKDTIYVKDSITYSINISPIHISTIQIYELTTGKIIQNLKLKTKEENTIVSGYFSKNKYTFCINNNGTFYLWSIPSGKSIKTVKADTVILSNISNSFFALQDNKINKISYFYGNKTEYDPSSAVKIAKLAITSDDKILIAMTERNRIYVWDVKNPETKAKTYFGNDFSTDNNGNLYISNYRKGAVTISKFNIPPNESKHKREKTIYSKKYINPGKIIKTTIVQEQSKFSPDGKYYSYTSKNLFSQKITTINLTTGDVVFKTEKKYRKYERKTPYFYSDSVCFLQKDENTVCVFDLNKKKITDEIECDKKISYEQVYYDKATIAIIENNDSTTVYTDKNNKRVIFDNNSFSNINTNGKYYFTKNENNKIVYYPLKNILKDSTQLQFNESTIKNKTIKKEFNTFKLDTFSYISIENLIHISQAKDTSIHFLVKSVQINEDNTDVQFYIIDNNNDYYYGVSDKEWLNSICGVTIENEYGETTEIKDFEITEFSEKQNTPIAICFVLDHSGSMGETNSKAMQTGVIDLITKVKGNEGIAIIKFSDNTEETIKLKDKKSRIPSKFPISGLTNFGGSTALLDGIDSGLDVLINDKKYQNKAIIVLTDGYENSSSSTKNQVLLKAINNGIGIYTIGFGSSIDVEFLQSISKNSSGGYYWINDKEQLDEVFSDIYKNMKNYYTLQFNTPYPGNYKITLELCLDDIYTNVDYYFDNYVPDLLFTDNPDEYDQLFNEITGISDTVALDDFNSNKITEDIEYNTLKEEFYALKFPDIKFYFDETRIVEGTDKELINVINFMKEHPEIRIEIQGHTDSKGGYYYNEKLSQARAEKVRQMIVAQGIDSQRIRTIGYGKNKPIDTNETDEGRQKNRRVEFLLVR